MRNRTTALLLLILSGAWLCDHSVTAQQQPASVDPQPQFRSGVELVTVDVGVFDKQGKAVHGLGPADFVVTVGGEKRHVVTAEFIDVDGTRAAAAPGPDRVPISTNEGGGVGRMIVFIVDSSSLETGEGRQVASAAGRFFTQLTWADRTAIMTLPAGTNVPFTWAHERVRQALSRITGTGALMANWEYGSLSEARDIVTRGPFAARDIGARECGGMMSASAAGFGDLPSPPTGTTGQSSPSGGTSSGGASGGSSSGNGGGGGQSPGRPPARVGSPGDLSSDRCMREIESSAEMAWGAARANSLASLTALRQVFASLARVPGDKTVVLISGGWPMDEREQQSDLNIVAADAAAARATVYSLFVPHSDMSASRPRLVFTSMKDQSLYSWALENLASMTGGRWYRADVGVEATFDRLAREIGSFYRIGVEKTPSDGDSNNDRLKIQVARSGVTVRSRQVFDAPTYEDRDWAARLASALESPSPATGLALRVTSYVAPDPDDTRFLRLVLSGDASRLQPGAATLQVLVRNLDGQNVVHGEQRLGEPGGSTLPFATNVRVSPGNYVVRLAVMDGAGHVGSVDHRVDVRPVSFGAVAVTGPMLVQLPWSDRGQPHVTLDTVRRDERLAIQVGLDGERAKVAATQVVFEIASTPDGPALIQQPATASTDQSGGPVLAQVVADLRVLPPGQYIARVKLNSGGEPIGEVHRAFAVIEPAAATIAGTTGASTAISASHGARPAGSIRSRALALARPFATDDVLAPQVLNGFLERVAARPDASLPAAAELLNRARTTNIADLNVSDAQAVQTPIAAFLRGLSLLARKQLDPAAAAFRSAMRASPDFYPAMVYLGACYAAGGRDKDASAVWRTALIKEGDARALHVMLGDALLREGSADVALQTVAAARARWPEDDQLKQRFVTAALSAGRYSDALQTLDDLVARGAADEPSHILALLVLYESLTTGHPIEGAEQDRARMMRLADAYRARRGPSTALVDTWVKAVNK